MPFAGRNTDLQRSYHGRATDFTRAANRLLTDYTRAAHGLAYGLLTDGRRAGFGQTWTSPDVPRWAAADCAAHGLETDWRRVRDNARGCLRTLRVRLTPNLPSESIRFLRHIYHEYAQRTTHGRATDFPYRTSSSPSSPPSPCSNSRGKANKEDPGFGRGLLLHRIFRRRGLSYEQEPE